MFAIRDDVSTSLSTAERDLITSTATKHHHHSSDTTSHSAAASSMPRVDGRGPWDRRPVQLDLVRGENRAVATVKLGAGTRVTATITGELGPPLSEQRPNEGSVTLAVDLSPVASTAFRHATPATTSGGGGSSGNPLQQQQPADRHQKLTANRILRCLERCLLNSSSSGGGGGALDAEALCVVPGRFVWKLNIRVTVLDAAGNLTDAAVLACLAAVRHYRKPCTETNADANNNNNNFEIPRLVPANFKEPTPLPLHHTPLTITLALFASPDDDDDDDDETKDVRSNNNTAALLVDPTHREELCQTGQVTLALNVHRELCWLDFSGGCEITVADLRHCYRHAVPHAIQLSQSLEQTLQAADERARQERLAAALLQKAQLIQPPLRPLLPPLPSTDNSLEDRNHPPPNVPFWQTLPERAVETNVGVDAANAAAAEEDEVYRQRALDYNVGHVATHVRENHPKNNQRDPPRPAPNSLLTALLQSVQPQPAPPAPASRSSTMVPPVPTSNVVRPPVRANAAPKATAAAAATSGSTTTPRTAGVPAAKKASPTMAATMTLAEDDDEEEEVVTLQLQSEFQAMGGAAASAPAVPPATLPSHSTRTTTTTTTTTTLDTNKDDDDDDDVDDLAAAIKNKSSKKKKKR